MHSKNRESALKNLSSDLEAADQEMDVESAVCVWWHCINKNPKCNSDMGFWEGICSNMSWKGWILHTLPRTNSACSEEPCLVQAATGPVGFRIFECTAVLCPWWKGFVYSKKRKVAFCFGKSLSTIIPIISLDKRKWQY